MIEHARYLQRAAGNKALSQLLTQGGTSGGVPDPQRHPRPEPLDDRPFAGEPLSTQREPAPAVDAGAPAESPVQKALRTKDPGDAKAVDATALAGASINQRLDLIRVLAYQGWVGPRDESKIEEIWATIPSNDLPAIASREILLWNQCIDVGAELDKIPTVKELKGSYLLDIRGLAADYLDENKKYVEAQMTEAGLPKTEGIKAEPPSQAQAKKIQEMQAAAVSVANNQAEQEKSRQVYVGYKPTKVKGGGGEIWDKYAPARFNPFKPPELADPPASTLQITTIVQTTPYRQLKAAYDESQARTRAVLNEHPMLYAISREGNSDVTGAFSQIKDPAQARAQLAGAMRKLFSDIEATEKRLSENDSFVLDLVPIQEQLYAGKKSRHPYADWSLQMPQQIGREVKAEHDFANALEAMGLQVVGAAAFLLAPLTSGASLAALLAVGVTAAGVKAYESGEQYEGLLQASKTAAQPGTELVGDAQVDEAKEIAEADKAALQLAVITAAALGGTATLKWASERAAAQPPGAAAEQPIPLDTRWIGKGDDRLAKGAGWLSPVPGKWDVLVHGEPDGFWLYERTPGPGGFYVGPGASERWTEISHRNLARYMKSTGWNGQPVRLLACNTGNSAAGPPVAQDLANKLGVTVTAPTEKVWIHPDGRVVVSDKPPEPSGDHVSTGAWVDFRPGANAKP